ncbi:protein ParA (plasmid) [Maritalea myrionectae]|uniref:Protein ParA n=1 Tax=Maritalea myrionectae TaxID=454601 RepID=A0A2R4MJ18_9HYPH|nr:ParA family protein [Maritalea myrionectae]AVX05959.1 protein ParA [Maritalea myrionectae]
MPIISFANPKGGAGKTTSALLLANVLASKGAGVTIVDADPEKWISGWANLSDNIKKIEIRSDVTEDSIVDIIEDAARKTQFVIVDLEGTASLMVANAIGMSDLVLIPTQGASMDARGAAKTIKLIKNQARLARREIPHSVVFTRTSAAVASRSLKNVRSQLEDASIPVLKTSIVERAAYRDLLDFGGLLENLPSKDVSNLEKAIKNASEFTRDILELLEISSKKGRAA